MTASHHRDRLIRRLAAWIVSLILVCGALIIAVIALVGEQSTGDCVNRTLGGRSSITIDSASAQRDFAAADRAYNAVINGLITHPARTKAQQSAQRAALVAASAAKASASNRYYNAMTAVLRTSAEHPLGRC